MIHKAVRGKKEQSGPECRLLNWSESMRNEKAGQAEVP